MLKDWLLANAKALTALLTAVVAFVALKKGLKLDDGTTTAIASMVVSMLVYLVPNTPRVPASERVTPQEGAK